MHSLTSSSNIYAQLNRQAVRFEGTELGSGLWTVFTCLKGAGRKRNVRACYQLRLWTRRKHIENSQIKENPSGPIPHSSPHPQKRQGQGIVHI